VAGLALLASVAILAQGASSKPEKIEPVAVVGCLKELEPGAWTLMNATEPVPSSANAPSAKELAALGKSGKNEFHLIGVSVYNLPAYRDRSVVVKGLPIKASPISRLNITSVTTIAATCPAR
jgi:hypothetical protein